MPVTFQALSERDRKMWMEAMDGKEPVSLFLISVRDAYTYTLKFSLNVSFWF